MDQFYKISSANILYSPGFDFSSLWPPQFNFFRPPSQIFLSSNTDDTLLASLVFGNLRFVEKKGRVFFNPKMHFFFTEKQPGKQSRDLLKSLYTFK